MFGYVKPYQPELRVKELTAYKAVYCGLCDQLSRSFGPAARLILSYDFTFLSMLYWGVNGGEVPASQCRCPLNPLKKQLTCTGGEALELGADAAIIMIYYKLLDNIHDSGFFSRIGWSLLRPAAAAARRPAAGRRPQQEKLIADSVSRQAELEAAQTDSIDQASEPTAAMLAGVFRLLTTDSRQQRVLERLGYLVGRYIYLCDALDDMEKDTHRGGYNPFVLRYGLNSGTERLKEACDAAVDSLYMTIGEAEKTFALLELQDFAPILGNIVSLGMRAVVDEIRSKKEIVR